MLSSRHVPVFANGILQEARLHTVEHIWEPVECSTTLTPLMNACITIYSFIQNDITHDLFREKR